MIQHKTGVLLVNLGTPDSAKTGDVRRYLTEFLTDGRVIDVPWLPRQLLVRGLIGPFRANSSAKTYKAIWDEEKGSPLKFISEELTELIQQSLDKVEQNETKYLVELAMRYQSPSIEQALNKLRKQDVQQYIVVPLFPQYASATTGSVHQKVMEIVCKWQSIPSISFINSYFDHPKFIHAFTEIGRTYNPHEYDHVLFSFHGLPQRQLRKADDYNYCLKEKDCCKNLSIKNQFCYGAHCYNTATAIAQNLEIPEEKFTVCYQSRLGPDPWMQPYTVKTLEELAEQGKKRVLVFCPAFVADCLETIFEIGEEYQEEFEEWGGEKVQLVESLNTHPLWVDALTDIILGK